MKVLIETDHLFCLPLRAGLILWGYIQLVYTIGYLVFFGINFEDDIDMFRFYYFNPHMEYALGLIATIIVLIWLICDAVCFGFLIVGLHKDNANYMEVCYHYMKVKVLLHIMFGLLGSNGPYRHQYFFILYSHTDLAFIVLVLHLLLMLMIKAMMHKLGADPDFSSLWRRLRGHAAVTQEMTKESLDV